MVSPSLQPILLLITFGLSTLFVGGYLGGEMARRQHVKEDLKALQQEHEKTLARIDSAFQRASLREQSTLAQIDSVYSILGELNVKENKTRGNINAISTRLTGMKEGAKNVQAEIINDAADSEITLKKKTAN